MSMKMNLHTYYADLNLKLSIKLILWNLIIILKSDNRHFYYFEKDHIFTHNICYVINVHTKLVSLLSEKTHK
jgi:hypothetical protein